MELDSYHIIHLSRAFQESIDAFQAKGMPLVIGANPKVQIGESVKFLAGNTILCMGVVTALLSRDEARNRYSNIMDTSIFDMWSQAVPQFAEVRID